MIDVYKTHDCVNVGKVDIEKGKIKDSIDAFDVIMQYYNYTAEGEYIVVCVDIAGAVQGVYSKDNFADIIRTAAITWGNNLIVATESEEGREENISELQQMLDPLEITLLDYITLYVDNGVFEYKSARDEGLLKDKGYLFVETFGPNYGKDFKRPRRSKTYKAVKND